MVFHLTSYGQFCIQGQAIILVVSQVYNFQGDPKYLIFSFLFLFIDTIRFQQKIKYFPFFSEPIYIIEPNPS